jgi:hypothetical protein
MIDGGACFFHWYPETRHKSRLDQHCWARYFMRNLHRQFCCWRNPVQSNAKGQCSHAQTFHIFSKNGERCAVFQMTNVRVVNDVMFLTDSNIPNVLTRENNLLFSSWVKCVFQMLIYLHEIYIEVNVVPLTGRGSRRTSAVPLLLSRIIYVRNCLFTDSFVKDVGVFRNDCLVCK